ncbi:DNA replication licensing factor MCM7 [Exophiala xenobiotica]|nr:DNA replication licensing factor MCM7 [Exophiala xenobiotica]
MALLQHKALADYAKQLEAFQSFLEKFETSKTSSDAAAEAIDSLHLDGDHSSDEYDFMDDVADGDGTSARRRPKRKYMEMLQEVADRERQNILIDLDDLQEFEDSLPADLNLRLVESVTNNTKHYVDLFSDAVDKVLPKESKDISYVIMD